MFDGKTRPQRIVDLGGKKRDSNQQDFLQKTAKLREDRAAERLRNNCAILLQKHFRRYTVCMKTRGLWANELDNRILDITKLEAVFSTSGSSFSIPLDILEKLMRLLIFSYDGNKSILHIEMVLSLLLKSLSHVHEKFNYLFHLQSIGDDDLERVRSWQFLVANVLRCSLFVELTEGAHKLITLLSTLTNASYGSNSIIAIAAINGTFRIISKDVCLRLRCLVESTDICGSETNDIYMRDYTTCFLSIIEISTKNDIVRQADVLGNQACDYIKAWDAFTEIILTLPSLEKYKYLKELCFKLNMNNGAGWATSFRLSSLFKKEIASSTSNSKQKAAKQRTLSIEMALKSLKLRFFINFLNNYFQITDRQFALNSLNEILLVPTDCSDKAFDYSWILELADCITLLPLASLMSTDLATDDNAALEKLVHILNDKSGGGMKRLETLIAKATIDEKKIENDVYFALNPNPKTNISGISSFYSLYHVKSLY